jgi:hypothetical protein
MSSYPSYGGAGGYGYQSAAYTDYDVEQGGYGSGSTALRKQQMAFQASVEQATRQAFIRKVR